MQFNLMNQVSAVSARSSWPTWRFACKRTARDCRGERVAFACLRFAWPVGSMLASSVGGRNDKYMLARIISFHTTARQQHTCLQRPNQKK